MITDCREGAGTKEYKLKWKGYLEETCVDEADLKCPLLLMYDHTS